jgi:perosamine synthetase
LGNLETIDDKFLRINEIAQYYNENLKNVSGLTQMKYNSDRKSSYWLYPLLVENRIEFIKKLKSLNIPTSVVHLGIDKNTIFGGINEELANQRFWDSNQIHIPINDELTDDDIIKIVSIIKEGW